MSVAGGLGSKICCCSVSSAAFGVDNVVTGGKNSVVFGGAKNEIQNCSTSTTSQNNVIVGGRLNCIRGIQTSVPCAPQNSVILAGCYSTIIGCNVICNAVIPVGDHTICGGCNVVIFSGCCNFTVNASKTTCVCFLVKSSGTFQIRHPEPGKYQTHVLQHSFVESPAADNIYRYRVETKSCTATLSLPDYYKWLNERTQVHIQPVDNYGKAFATVDENQSELTICSTEDGKFDLLVIGQRKDDGFKENYEGQEFLI